MLHISFPRNVRKYGGESKRKKKKKREKALSALFRKLYDAFDCPDRTPFVCSFVRSDYTDAHSCTGIRSRCRTEEKSERPNGSGSG